MSAHPFIISGRNINDVYATGVRAFKAAFKHGSDRIIGVPSRVGPTLEHCGPVITHYLHPLERVLLDPVRDCNPFFHFFESLWILAGRNDVKWLSFFLGNIKKFSDDGITFNGAYGYRLRKHFPDMGESQERLDHDQLKWLVQHLSKDINSRRAVVSMFDPSVDHEERSLDIPCNTSIAFLFREGQLNMTVFNRSNDMIWGAYGANAVHFSYILEYVAAMLNVRPGAYTQVSNSFHIYVEEPTCVRVLAGELQANNPYTYSALVPYPIGTGMGGLDERQKIFDSELEEFMQMVENCMPGMVALNLRGMFYCRILEEVAEPLFNAYVCYKHKDFATAIDWAQRCAAYDWSRAAVEWLQKRDTTYV